MTSGQAVWNAIKRGAQAGNDNMRRAGRTRWNADDATLAQAAYVVELMRYEGISEAESEHE